MRQLLEHLGAIGHSGAAMTACAECGHVLGPLSSGYKQFTAQFDEPISAGQPPGLVSPDETFILRHYCCPECATLFEVDMVARTAPEIASFDIDESLPR